MLLKNMNNVDFTQINQNIIEGELIIFNEGKRLLLKQGNNY